MTLPSTGPSDPEEFDPYTVPTFPVVPVRVSLSDAGDTKAEFNGHPVDVPPGQDPIAALMQRAAIAAADRPLRAIRLAATDSADRTWPVVVHADGRTWDMSPRTVPTRPTRRKVITIASVATLAVALTGAAGTVLVLRDGEDTTVAATPTTPAPGDPGESPVVPVDGWTRRAVWTSPALVNDAPPLVSDDAVVTQTQTADRNISLTSLDPDTGGIIWQTPLDTRLDQSPDLAEVDSELVITGTTQGQLLTWDLAGTPLQRYDLPTDAILVPESKAPLAYSERQAVAITLDGDDAVQRVMPAGARPISADGQGKVYAADDLGNWWALTDERVAPSPQRLEPPDAESVPVEVLGVAGRTLVVLWSTAENEDEATSTLTGYGLDADLAPVWTSVMQDGQDADWYPDPSGTWAVLGRTSIDVETGDITELPDDWTTAAITTDAAWSLTGETGYIAQPSSEARPLASPPDQAGLPVAVNADRALILATSANSPRLYALQADTGLPYDTSGSTATAGPTPRP